MSLSSPASPPRRVGGAGLPRRPSPRPWLAELGGPPAAHPPAALLPPSPRPPRGGGARGHCRARPRPWRPPGLPERRRAPRRRRGSNGGNGAPDGRGGVASRPAKGAVHAAASPSAPSTRVLDAARSGGRDGAAGELGGAGGLPRRRVLLRACAPLLAAAASSSLAALRARGADARPYPCPRRRGCSARGGPARRGKATWLGADSRSHGACGLPW